MSDATPTLLLRVHGRELPLRGQRLHIGRHPACDIVLQDATVSRHHAVLRREGERWYVEDAGSRHGTWLDGEPVRGGAPIRPGQRLKVGSIEIVVAEHAPERVGRARRSTAQGIRAPRRPRPLSAPPPSFGFSDASQIEALVLSARRALEVGQEGRLPELARSLRASVRGGLAESPPSEMAFRALGEFALQAAGQHGVTDWLDAWLEVAGAARRLPPMEQVEGLAALHARGVRPSEEALAGCLSRLCSARDTLGAQELKRLERLAQLHGGRVEGVVRIPSQDD